MGDRNGRAGGRGDNSGGRAGSRNNVPPPRRIDTPLVIPERRIENPNRGFDSTKAANSYLRKLQGPEYRQSISDADRYRLQALGYKTKEQQINYINGLPINTPTYRYNGEPSGPKSYNTAPARSGSSSGQSAGHGDYVLYKGKKVSRTYYDNGHYDGPEPVSTRGDSSRRDNGRRDYDRHGHYYNHSRSSYNDRRFFNNGWGHGGSVSFSFSGEIGGPPSQEQIIERQMKAREAREARMDQRPNNDKIRGWVKDFLSSNNETDAKFGALALMVKEQLKGPEHAAQYQEAYKRLSYVRTHKSGGGWFGIGASMDPLLVDGLMATGLNTAKMREFDQAVSSGHLSEFIAHMNAQKPPSRPAIAPAEVPSELAREDAQTAEILRRPARARRTNADGKEQYQYNNYFDTNAPAIFLVKPTIMPNSLQISVKGDLSSTINVMAAPGKESVLEDLHKSALKIVKCPKADIEKVRGEFMKDLSEAISRHDLKDLSAPDKEKFNEWVTELITDPTLAGSVKLSKNSTQQRPMLPTELKSNPKQLILA